LRSLADLRNFCAYIIHKYGSPSGATEEDKAREFRKLYLHNFPLDLKTLRAIALVCGIDVSGVDGKKLPQNIRGYHVVFGDRRNIYYKNDDTVSGIENTILHEFREMIEPVFAELCSDYSALRTSALHLAANKFATAVLLPKDAFRDKVYETGFDVVALSKLYAKSCSQVLLRMGEVLQGSIFMYSALYEEGPEVGSWTVNYWTASANDHDPEANIYGGDGLFPRKGKAVMPGSLVDMVIKEHRPFLGRRISVLESRDDDSLVALAIPVPVNGSPAKVILISMLSYNIKLIQPQIDRLKPVIIEGFHRHL